MAPAPGLAKLVLVGACGLDTLPRISCLPSLLDLTMRSSEVRGLPPALPAASSMRRLSVASNLQFGTFVWTWMHTSASAAPPQTAGNRP